MEFRFFSFSLVIRLVNSLQKKMSKHPRDEYEEPLEPLSKCHKPLYRLSDVPNEVIFEYLIPFIGISSKLSFRTTCKTYNSLILKRSTMLSFLVSSKFLDLEDVFDHALEYKNIIVIIMLYPIIRTRFKQNAVYRPFVRYFNDKTYRVMKDHTNQA